jgi:hypothetical protein
MVQVSYFQSSSHSANLGINQLGTTGYPAQYGAQRSQCITLQTIRGCLHANTFRLLTGHLLRDSLHESAQRDCDARRTSHCSRTTGKSRHPISLALLGALGQSSLLHLDNYHSERWRLLLRAGRYARVSWLVVQSSFQSRMDIG